MTNLKFNQTTEARSKIMSRLTQLGLKPDERMMKTLKENPQYLNRLTSLFNVLKEYNIKLNDKLHDTIASNVRYAGNVVNLLIFIYQEGFDITHLSLELLFAAGKSEEMLMWGLRRLKTSNSLDSATLSLMFAYPGQSSSLAELIINFHDHAHSTEKIVEKLHKFSPKNMYTTIELVAMLLNNDLYYSECLDIFLRQQNYIDKIYQGAKNLVKEPYLIDKYFEFLEQNPENANIFAKNLLLLQSASLINNDSSKKDYLMVTKLGIGAFHFLTHLQQADMLNAENYQKICQHNSILTQKEVIESLCNIPLFESFNKDELEQMLLLITQEPYSETNLNAFNEMVQKHLFISKTSSLGQ